MVRGLYDSFAKGDVPAVLGAFDPNIEWNEAENFPVFAEGNPYRGPKAVAEGVFMRIPQYWNNFRVNVEKVIDGGDTVVVLGRYTATNKVTNLPLNAQFVHVWNVSNGKLTRFQQYADTAQVQRVSGLK
jgi:ketosteroid isomerase-like protein